MCQENTCYKYRDILNRATTASFNIIEAVGAVGPNTYPNYYATRTKSSDKERQRVDTPTRHKVGDVIATHDSHHPHHYLLPNHTTTPFHRSHTITSLIAHNAHVAGRRHYTTAPHRGTCRHHHPTGDSHCPRTRHRRVTNALRQRRTCVPPSIILPPPPLRSQLSSPLVLDASPPIIQ